ncbi:MAG: BACON domain-containing protein [Alistipes sp.]|nr:BACON domain-containing protein [Alistipes sp.]
MRYLYKLVTLFVALWVVGCSDPEPVVVHSLTLSERGVVFGSRGGEQRLTVTPFPESVLWSVDASEAEAWFEVVAQQGAVVVIAQPNDTTSPRVGSFLLTSDDELFEAIEVAVSQEAGQCDGLAVSAAESYEFDSQGGSYTFMVYSQSEWSVACGSDWLSVASENQKVAVTAEPNTLADTREAEVVVTNAEGQSVAVTIKQQTVAQNRYLRLTGEWEISASKWFYSPNGSLNELDYNPSPSDYYLIFKMEQGEYGKTLIMRDFLYPGTSLEVRYDSQSGKIIIPFGWSVLSYDVFLYITLISSNKFSYGSFEVDALPSEDYMTLTLVMPSVDGFTYTGFGLWTYGDSGDKVALGYRSQPTMFPMGKIVFRKYSN